MHSVADVQMTLIIAFVLVVMVIFAFLGRATDTLIPAVALPLVAADHVHGDARAGLQSRQLVVDGPDAGDWIPG